MRNLLYFTSDYSIGLSAMMVDQLVALKNSGINVFSVGGEKEQEIGLADFAKSNGIDIIRIKGLDEHAKFTYLVNRISKIILDNNISIVHIQNNWQLALMGVVKHKIKPKIEIIYTIHGFRHNHPFKSKIAQLMIGTGLFAFSDHIICMTDYVKRKFNLLSYKIKILPLGVKQNYFIKSFIEPKIDSLRLIFPAQFRKGKNQDLIINAFYEYIKETHDRNSILILPGNGPLLDKMKEYVKELNIHDQIIFPGFVNKDEIKDLYLDSNIAIVSSNSETFGQSIVEPFVLGRCVVSTPVGIAPEIIEDGKNGYLFKTQNDLTNILIKLNRNRDKIKTIGLKNFSHRNLFNWNEISKKYKSIFNL